MGKRYRPMEGLGLKMGSYVGRPILVTGHTGFKGSWLSHWLLRLGAKVYGVALPPEGSPNLFDELSLARRIDHRVVDVRDRASISETFASIQPEIVFHLAAQALVRRGYREPVETFGTNVMGTAHVLEACRATPSVRAVVVVTSDKCYAPDNDHPGYRENDPLGGLDPYSASKACQEWVAQSWQASFGTAGGAPLIATVRAGNVIGGGDWAEDRLVPDLVRAFHAGRTADIRNPSAIRPWQHVLEPLSGYLTLGARLLAGERAFARAWNFGPDDNSMRPVADLCANLTRELGGTWSPSAGMHPHEAACLRLNSQAARELLGWQPRWDFAETLRITGAWYRRHAEGASAIDLCNEQLHLYESRHE